MAPGCPTRCLNLSNRTPSGHECRYVSGLRNRFHVSSVGPHRAKPGDCRKVSRPPEVSVPPEKQRLLASKFGSGRLRRAQLLTRFKSSMEVSTKPGEKNCKWVITRQIEADNFCDSAVVHSKDGRWKTAKASRRRVARAGCPLETPERRCGHPAGDRRPRAGAAGLFQDLLPGLPTDVSVSGAPPRGRDSRGLRHLAERRARHARVQRRFRHHVPGSARRPGQRLSSEKRFRDFERADAVPGGARRRHFPRDRRLAQEGNGVPRRQGRRTSLPPGRQRPGMESRLRLAQLAARRAATLEWNRTAWPIPLKKSSAPRAPSPRG